MQPQDIALTVEDISALSSPQEALALFARLGYNTAACEEQRQPPRRAGLLQRLHSKAETRQAIQDLYPLARLHSSQTRASLNIYLYRLNDLSMSLKRRLARDLHAHQDEFLLLLADAAFQRLELVFLDRRLPASAEPQLRTLAIDRQRPTYATLKALREMRCVSQDPLEQCLHLSEAYDKLDHQRDFFVNSGLFSHYYLEERLSASDEPVAEWQHEQALTEAYNRLRGLFLDADEVYAGSSLRDLRQQLIEPVLEILGFPRPRGSASGQADYLLLVEHADGSQSQIPCRVYPWNRSLDETRALGPDQAQERDRENPAMEMVALLRTTDAPWGILTNGRQWRLYSARARSRATCYYEVDAGDLFALPRGREDTLSAFRYFWLFFRADAFRRRARREQPEPPYLCFLDFVMRESAAYARALGDSLKQRIFEEVFPHFAQGFVRYAQDHALLPPDLSQRGDEERNALLQPYFQGTLVFLYRLLIIFYAESRALLPIHDARYYEQSLRQLTDEIASAAGPNREQAPRLLAARYSADSSAISLYTRLQALFRAIDRGDRNLNVPAYDGDIFRCTIPAEKPRAAWDEDERISAFLEEHCIADYYLALGLDLLARDEDPRKGATARNAHTLLRLDYRTLGVRQLGSIYEGLLEFKLRLAVEEMVVVKGAFRPRREVPNLSPRQIEARLAPGQVYIENDRHERKATGSYYTPDYVVAYIVEQTVGPIIAERLNEGLRQRFRRFQEDLLQRQRQTPRLREPQLLWQIAREEYSQLIEDFFAIRVLDPAMGSGHFLVEALDYITDQMIEFLRPFQPNPIHLRLPAMQQEILSEAERQQVSIERARLSEVNLLRRQVLKRCIFGVDLNPMAVKLARVSLWTHAFCQGAPFSFLDHHLRCGNSLLGVTLASLQAQFSRYLHTINMSDLLLGAQTFLELSRIADATTGELERSQTLYNAALQLLAPYRRLADLWLSASYNNEGARLAVEEAGEDILHNRLAPERTIVVEEAKRFNSSSRTRPIVEILAQAERLARRPEKRFFHWDLEFPEVFYDRQGSRSAAAAGFDAVIGNPPYVRQEGLGEEKQAFRDLYADVYDSIADLYTYFIRRGHALLRAGGRFGMITANKFMRAKYGARLRAFLTQGPEVRLEHLIDFGDLPVFEEAITYPVIIISSRAERDQRPISYALLTSLPADFAALQTLVAQRATPLPESAFGGTNWSLASSLEHQILSHVLEQSLPLGKMANNKINRGIITGLNQAFIIDKATRDRLVAADPASAEVLKPLVLGEDIRRYEIESHERYLIWTYIGIPIQQYPAIYSHLAHYQDRLEKRWDKGNHWWELRHCDYYDDFEKPKIIYPDIAERCKFCFDDQGFYSLNTTYMLPLEKRDFYLLALLNSSLIEFFYRFISATIRGGYLRFFKQYIAQTPIRRIAFVTPQETRHARRAEALRRCWPSPMPIWHASPKPRTSCTTCWPSSLRRCCASTARSRPHSRPSWAS